MMVRRLYIESIPSIPKRKERKGSWGHLCQNLWVLTVQHHVEVPRVPCQCWLVWRGTVTLRSGGVSREGQAVLDAVCWLPCVMLKHIHRSLALHTLSMYIYNDGGAVGVHIYMAGRATHYSSCTLRYSKTRCGAKLCNSVLISKRTMLLD